jgi:carboxyl-terminal processing protease
MRGRYWTVFGLPLLAIFLLCSIAPPFQLKKPDVREAMDQMLSYHVDYKQFSPLIARRSLRVFVEQFDSEKLYLLSHEVRPFLDPKEDRLKGMVQKYLKDDLSEYEGINQIIQRAILRARGLRQEVEAEIVLNPTDIKAPLTDSYAEYPKDEAELKERIKKQLLRILTVEKRNGKMRALTTDKCKKLFDLWEKRFARFESTYLSSSGARDHYLCMHILKALGKSLDAHTSYFSPEEAYEMRTSLEKQFEGIGVVLKEGVDGVVIHDMIKGGPAERCGKIRSGDMLVQIDGQSMEGASYDDILKKLQGSGSGQIEIGLRHFKEDEVQEFYTVQLKREKIVMQDDRVQYTFEPYGDGIIGKINLPSFYEGGGGTSCATDLRAALRALKKEGDLRGLVLDMRENSGGFLNQAVKVGGLFISSGVIVISKYAKGETQYHRDLDAHFYYNGPLVVLTSRSSASAAEIVAQALQDYGTALIVGDDRTYGKGTIQYQTITDKGAESFFKVTVGRYYTVSGRTPQVDGVKADIVVPTEYSVYPIGERYLAFPLKSDRIPSAYVDPLNDVDPRNRSWFQKNYLPNVQKKLSLWTQMLPELSENSAYRLKQNKDYALFLKAIGQEKTDTPYSPSAKENWGVDDLQMVEAVNIVKDMNQLKPAAAKKVANLFN